MPKDLALDKFAKFVSDNVEAIGGVRREVEEIQVGFNSAYVEWKAQHDATLERLVEAVYPRLDEVGPELRSRVEDRLVEERRLIAERRQELEQKLIPEAQAQADQSAQQGQRLIEELRLANPRLDRQEEDYKAQRAALRGQLKQLNSEIKRRSGCFFILLNFGKVNRLDRQRQKVIGQLEAIEPELKRVREEWKQVNEQVQGQQGTLGAKWQELTLQLAQMHGERDYLAVESNRASLALRRAIRYVLDNLKQQLACPVEPIKHDMDAMVELNVQTDLYHDALGAVVGFLALLKGIAEGLGRFSESVKGLMEELRMHSAHLPALNISVPDDVLAFHTQWGGLAQKVHDDKYLSTHPAEFMAAVQPIVDRDLSEAKIKAMFENLGQALERATKKWRG